MLLKVFLIIFGALMIIGGFIRLNKLSISLIINKRVLRKINFLPLVLLLVTTKVSSLPLLAWRCF